MNSTDSRRAILVLLAITLICCALPAVAQTTIAQKIADPAYYYPVVTNNVVGPPWSQLLENNAPGVGIAVVNVINGPGYPVNSDYLNAITTTHATGVKVLGYVDTGFFGTSTYTPRATRLGLTDTASWLSQIESDVNAWYALYGSGGIDGIFFDEGQNVCGTNNSYANLYAEIQNYVKFNHPGAIVAVNSGSPVPQCFQNTADILVTFEGTYLCYIQDQSCSAPYTPLDWNPIDPNKIWHLVYNVTQPQFANAASLSKQRNAGYFYITPDTVPNPWDTLPPDNGYWTAEEAAAPSGGTPDLTIPTAPDTLDTVDVGPTWAILNWGPSTNRHGSGVVGYDVYQNGNYVASVPASANPQITVNGLTPSTNYSFTATARTVAGNRSPSSNTLLFTTDVRDGWVQTPGNLHVTQTTYTSATLAWNASNACCDYTVTYYDIYQSGVTAPILTVDASITSITVVGLTPGQTATFTVKARDNDGDVSSSSASLNVTPPALPNGNAVDTPTGSYTSTTATYTANYYLPFALRHVYIDSDSNANTGFRIGWTTPALGVDYMIENNTLYQYAGTGSDWTWTSVGTINPTTNGYAVSWQVPVSLLTNHAATQRAIFEGDGFAPTAYSSTILLTQQ